MKPVVGIFAHPDDEVFGPGGTLAKFAKDGRDVYLISATNGDAGMNNTDDTRELGEIRKEELQKSAKILGIKEVFFLEYKDGTLCNNLYHEIASKIQAILEKIQPEIILTWEPRGVSGHLDHIAISMISSYVFEQMTSIEEIWYYALTEEFRTNRPPYYIYFPPGYKKSDITTVIDINSTWDQKVEAMHQHKTQEKDMKNLLGQFMNFPKIENFIVTKRPIRDTE